MTNRQQFSLVEGNWDFTARLMAWGDLSRNGFPNGFVYGDRVWESWRVARSRLSIIRTPWGKFSGK